jgi:hypothetical protein
MQIEPGLQGLFSWRTLEPNSNGQTRATQLQQIRVHCNEGLQPIIPGIPKFRKGAILKGPGQSRLIISPSKRYEATALKVQPYLTFSTDL